MAGISLVDIGLQVPVVLITADGDVDQYPQAVIYDHENSLITTLDLVHRANGLYAPSAAYVMPEEVFISVLYIVYEDSDHLIESTKYLRDIDVFIMTPEEVVFVMGVDGTVENETEINGEVEIEEKIEGVTEQ